MKEIKRFQESLLLIRRTIGWTAEEFGEKIGVTRQTINNLESGRNKLTKTQYIAMRSVIDVEILKHTEDTRMLQTLLDMLVDHPDQYPKDVINTLVEKANMLTPSILAGTSSRLDVSKEWEKTAKALGGFVNRVAMMPMMKAQTAVSEWLSLLMTSTRKSNDKDSVSSLHDRRAITTLYYDLLEDERHFSFNVSIEEALENAKEHQDKLLKLKNETEDSIRRLTPSCDHLDYCLAASFGIITGFIDAFFVGMPGDSKLGLITDEWVNLRVKDIAKYWGWKEKEGDTFQEAIKFLEGKFNVPYDQTNLGESTKQNVNLTPKNHHFYSLAHNPTIIGLIFSILDQFTNSAHFVIPGDLGVLRSVKNAKSFQLKGDTVISKIFYGVVNWMMHLLSDVAGSSTSKGRGMGIPSPLLTWINDIIVVQAKLGIPVSDLEIQVQEIACKVYMRGMDVRFQATQTIPVILNELLTRFMYSLRRLYHYLSEVPSEERTLSTMWAKCQPFENATVKRLLTVAHGTFLLIDIGDVMVRGLAPGKVNPMSFILRLNLVGLGRFSMSLYDEGNSYLERYRLEKVRTSLHMEDQIMNDYIQGLELLSQRYHDESLMTFIDDFKESASYQAAFGKSSELAKKRLVDKEYILKDKSDIDDFFNGGKLHEKEK